MKLGDFKHFSILQDFVNEKKIKFFLMYISIIFA